MSLYKKFFMLKKFTHDLNTPKPRYPLAKNITSQKLEHYYFLFTESRIAAGKDQKLLNKFDQNGIPLNRTYVDVKDKDFVYFPITIGQMGLAVYHTWLYSAKISDRNRFLKFAQWFLDQAQVSNDLGARWLTDVPLPQYHNPGPWQSAFVQARALNILLRAYQITDNKDFADLAELALTPFSIDVDNGGVTRFTDYGPFYEEYTAIVPTLVLNGMIFALFGIYDFVRVFPENKNAQDIFYQGIDTVINILPEFDLNFWSRYNLCLAPWYPDIDPATIQYQRLHVAQLKVLYHITNNYTLLKYAQLFNSQDNLLNAFKMYKLKFHSLKKINRL